MAGMPAASSMNQLNMSSAMNMPQMANSASFNQLQTNTYNATAYNHMGVSQANSGYGGLSSMNSLPHVNSAPGSMYAAQTNNMYAGQMHQVAQKFRILCFVSRFSGLMLVSKYVLLVYKYNLHTAS